MSTTILDTVRRIVGPRHMISRQEMADILAALAADGLDLRNDCMSETWDYDERGRGLDEQTPTQITRAAAVWADACQDITCISVGATGAIPHGAVRYDQPGSMAPMQHATLMFVSAALRGYEYDQVGQMRRKADRLLIVREDPLLIPPPETRAQREAREREERQPNCECDYGHKWYAEDPQAEIRGGIFCPTCGEPWV